MYQYLSPDVVLAGASEDIFDKQDFRQGEEHARPDRRTFAGMLFINDEGTENGGLIQEGAMTADGRIDSGLSLTFDHNFKVTSVDDVTRFG